MKINKIEIIPYKIKLKNTFINSRTEYSFKEGFIIELSIDDIVGYGEIVFLDGFVSCNKQEIYWKVEELRSLLIDNSSYTKNDLFDLFKVFISEIPPMHFGFDVALLDVLSKKKSISLAQYLNPESAMKSVKLSTVYLGAKTFNNKSVKVKLLCKNVKDDIDFLNDIFNQYPTDTLFRLDANKGYILSDALVMCDFLKNKNIDYLEEPLIDMSEKNLKKIKESFKIKIAIDETVLDHQDKTTIFIKSGLIDVVVLKASLYGGVNKILQLNRLINQHNVDLIFSSSLENYIGTMSIINIISALNLNSHHGVNNQLFFNFPENNLFNEESEFVDIESIKGIGVDSYGP